MITNFYKVGLLKKKTKLHFKNKLLFLIFYFAAILLSFWVINVFLPFFEDFLQEVQVVQSKFRLFYILF